jgi:hypothetical protein
MRTLFSVFWPPGCFSDAAACARVKSLPCNMLMLMLMLSGRSDQTDHSTQLRCRTLTYRTTWLAGSGISLSIYLPPITPSRLPFNPAHPPGRGPPSSCRDGRARVSCGAPPARCSTTAGSPTLLLPLPLLPPPPLLPYKSCSSSSRPLRSSVRSYSCPLPYTSPYRGQSSPCTAALATAPRMTSYPSYGKAPPSEYCSPSELSYSSSPHTSSYSW